MYQALSVHHPSRGGAAAARRAHNPEVVGSSPTPATNAITPAGWHRPGRPRPTAGRSAAPALTHLQRCLPYTLRNVVSYNEAEVTRSSLNPYSLGGTAFDIRTPRGRDASERRALDYGGPHGRRDHSLHRAAPWRHH